MLQYQIVNVRPGGEYSVAGCDVVLGFVNDKNEFVGQLTIKSVWLREKKDGNGYFISWPSAPRVKNGAVVKENGKAKYDNLVGLHGYEGANSKRPGEWAVSGASWELQEQLVQELLKLSKTATKVETGRGKATATTPTRKPRSAPAATVPAAEEGDDDLPF